MMIVLAIMAVAGLVLFWGGRFYAPLIGRVLGEQADRVTPAVAINDGRDYVPTHTLVVFAHHYASIAGAGPIIGPVLAILYGWGPALVWILLGGVFLGAVHDFVATYIAVREGGKNLTVVARRYIGKGAFVLLLFLLVAILALVCAAFLDLSATALTSQVDMATLQLSPDQTMFRVVDGQAVIGGIASSSVVVITACSPLIGFLYLKRKWPVWICSLLAIVICVCSIIVGLRWPMSVEPFTWKMMISGYVLIAAGLPVWLFLQSRDFINVHILYMGIVFLVVSLVAAAVRGGGQISQISGIPISNWAQGSSTLGPGWPMMFVIIACGSVSGFHSLCAGGTTCKQLRNEMAARKVGYYGMLLESFLAVCVVCCLVVGLSLQAYKGYCYPEGAEGNAILTFAMSVGHTANMGLGLPVAAGALGAMLLLEGFLITTLDTAVRLTRYLIEEGWATFFGRYDVFAQVSQGPREAVELVGADGISVEEPYMVGDLRDRPMVETRGLARVVLRTLKYYWVNSGLAVGLMLLLALTNTYLAVWKIFGSTNQLLAALSLLVGTTWLIRRGRVIWYTLLPAIFMLVTSFTMMIRLLVKTYIPGWQAGETGMTALLVADVLVLAMAVGIIGLMLRRWLAGEEKIAE